MGSKQIPAFSLFSLPDALSNLNIETWSATMPIVDILVPQMGEGLQEVILLDFHKQPGDTVKRDELIYSMETDKATMEVESPYEGVLREWLAKEGDVMEIGAPIARMEVAAVPEAVAPQPVAAAAATPAPSSPPETSAPSPALPAARTLPDIVIPPR